METKPNKPINYLQYNSEDHPGEFNTEDSQTIPGQTYTVSEVLFRFSNGTLPNIVKTPHYEDNPDFDNVDITQNPAFDMVDAENFVQKIKHQQSERKLKKDLEKEEEERKSNAEQKDDEVE